MRKLCKYQHGMRGLLKLGEVLSQESVQSLMEIIARPLCQYLRNTDRLLKKKRVQIAPHFKFECYSIVFQLVVVIVAMLRLVIRPLTVIILTSQDYTAPYPK
jgi:hypothetical protein